jgi:hypothetical protein
MSAPIFSGLILIVSMRRIICDNSGRGLSIVARMAREF